jgi:large subunit ribosomal protein L6
LHFSIKMKKEIFETIEIPEGVEANLDGEVLSVKGSEGENKREFDFTNLSVEKKDNQIIVGNKKATKSEKKRIGTITAHIKNLLKGVQEKFEYKLKICFSHFPMTAEAQGKEIIIKNFLGEKIPRKVVVIDGADIKIEKEIITVTSVDKEIAGQVAANFEKATKVPLKDRRVFQDGVFITHKCGREM